MFKGFNKLCYWLYYYVNKPQLQYKQTHKTCLSQIQPDVSQKRKNVIMCFAGLFMIHSIFLVASCPLFYS